MGNSHYLGDPGILMPGCIFYELNVLYFLATTTRPSWVSKRLLSQGSPFWGGYFIFLYPCPFFYFILFVPSARLVKASTPKAGHEPRSIASPALLAANSLHNIARKCQSITKEQT